MTSLPVELLLYIESFPEQKSIILLRPYKIWVRFFKNQRNYTNFKKGPRFLRHPVVSRNIDSVTGDFILRTRNFDLVSRNFDSVTRNFHLVTRNYD